LHSLYAPADDEEEVAVYLPGEGRIIRKAPVNPKAALPPHRYATLADRVRRFVRDAQLNYRRFFSSTEPELFPRLITRLATGAGPTYTLEDLAGRLQQLDDRERKMRRLGLEGDPWDFDQLMGQLDNLRQSVGESQTHTLTVLGSYVEHLESRAAARELVAKRLQTFERIVNEFLVDKKVEVNSRGGLSISSSAGEELQERQLSSGEFHLLFLMVAALVTRRRGTVIAIDEPEMSMHIAWQRQLVPGLLECASGAEPLLVLATHSPDLAAFRPDALVELT
jgi:hypothetical protein